MPGDKSISHRAVLLGAIARGRHARARLRPRRRHAGDGRRDARARRRDRGRRRRRARRHGAARLRAPERRRLRERGHAACACSTGILAGRDGRFELTGDESLRGAADGARSPSRCAGWARAIETDGRPRAARRRRLRPLHGIDYELPVASAQVKSAILLAGLNADGATTVVEPVPTRDHTELMLEAAGVKVQRRRSSVTVEPPALLRLGEVDVPGDFSSAAPLLVAAALVPGQRRDRARRRPQPAAHRPARRARADGRPRRPSSTAAAPAASRSATCRCSTRSSSRPQLDAHEVPLLVDELPLVALLGCARARRDDRPRRRRAAREGERPHRGGHRRSCGRAARTCRSREDGWTVTGVPTRFRGGHRRGPRRPPDRDARGRCRARVRSRASRSRAPRRSL